MIPAIEGDLALAPRPLEDAALRIVPDQPDRKFGRVLVPQPPRPERNGPRQRLGVALPVSRIFDEELAQRRALHPRMWCTQAQQAPSPRR